MKKILIVLLLAVSISSGQKIDLSTQVKNTLPVANGGTGAATIATGAYIKGAGTAAVTTQATPIPVADGGTSAATFASGCVLVGNGTIAFTCNTSNLSWNNSTNRLRLRTAAEVGALTIGGSNGVNEANIYINPTFANTSPTSYGIYINPTITSANTAAYTGLAVDLDNNNNTSGSSGTEHAGIFVNHMLRTASITAGAWGQDMHVNKVSGVGDGIMVGLELGMHKVPALGASRNHGLHLHSDDSADAISTTRAGTAVQIEGNAGWTWALRFFKTGINDNEVTVPDAGIDQNAQFVGASYKVNPMGVINGALKIDPTVVTVANTAVSTQMNSGIFPANSLVASKFIRIKAAGVYSTANATDIFTITLASGGVGGWHTFTNNAATVTNAAWSVEWIVIINTTGASGTAESQVPYAIVNGAFRQSGATATQAINTTGVRTLELDVQWSNALAGNTISLRQFSVEVLN